MFCIKTLNRIPSFAGRSHLVRSKLKPCTQQSVRKFRQRPKPGRSERARQLESVENPNIEGLQLDLTPNGAGIFKPFLFAVASSGVVFTGCALWQYEYMRTQASKIARGIVDREYVSFPKASEFRRRFDEAWNNHIQGRPGRKLAYTIIAINAGVFICWRLPPLWPLMTRYFMATPFGKSPSMSLLCAPFSHTSFMHMFVNMYVLTSFMPPVVQMLGVEQATAFYISAGIWSTLASHALKIVTRSPAASVGASGAILGMLGAVCYQYPEARLSIAFVDMLIPHSFTARQGLTGLIILDTLGVLLRWRFFDHAGHLGGVLFGLFYVLIGHKYIWDKREPIVKYWHKLRGDIRP